MLFSPLLHHQAVPLVTQGMLGEFRPGSVVLVVNHEEKALDGLRPLPEKFFLWTPPFFHLTLPSFLPSSRAPLIWK